MLTISRQIGDESVSVPLVRTLGLTGVAAQRAGGRRFGPACGPDDNDDGRTGDTAATGPDEMPSGRDTDLVSAALCGCGRSIRAVTRVLDSGRIVCRLCGSKFLRP